MNSHPEGGVELLSPTGQFEVVQAVLGTSLFPEGVEPQYTEHAGRIDVRQFAYDAVVHTLAGTEYFPDNPDVATTLSVPTVEESRAIVGGSKLLQLAVQQVGMANRFAVPHRFVPPQADAPDAPRVILQSKASRAIAENAQTVPADWTKLLTKPDAVLENDMFGVIAPTGAGKTIIEANLFSDAGVGQLATETAPAPTKALIIVPDTNLISQFTGQTGNMSFLRFLKRGIKVTSFSGDGKDASGDIVIATKQILPRAIRFGDIRPEEFALGAIDEGHHGLEPEMLKLLGVLGTRLYLVTATPSFSARRDLRHIARHVELETPRGATESGVSNAVRLYTFQAGEEPNSDTIMAARLASKWIKDGRKVVIYAQPGERSKQAVEIADLINTWSGDNPVAGFVRRDKADNKTVKADFDSGKLRCITTVRMLTEGWDGPVDTAIIIGPNYRFLPVAQKSGRATRLGPRESILAEILPPQSRIRSDRPMTSIWSIYGLEKVVQGQLIGRAERKPRTGRPPYKPRNTPGTHTDAPDHQELDLPPDLAAYLIDDQPVRSIIIAPGERAKMEPPPPGSVSVSELAARHNVPAEWLQKYVLDTNNCSYKGVWKLTDEGWDYERWYSAEAVEFLTSQSIPELATVELNESEIAELFGMNRKYMSTIIKPLLAAGALTPDERLSKKNNRLFNHYGPDDIQRIKEEVDKIPVAEETDAVLVDLCNELGASSVYYLCRKFGITHTNKRRNPAHDIRGFAHHITEEEAERIRDAQASIEVATSEDIGYTEIATIAGVAIRTAISSVAKNLTAQEQELLLRLKRPDPKATPRVFLPRSRGIAIAEKIKVRQLPPHLVTLNMVAAYLGKDPGTARYFLRKEKITKPVETINLGGQGGGVSCYRWSDLQAVEKYRSADASSEPIDFSQVVHDMADITEATWRYAQTVQGRYIATEKLVAPFAWVNAHDALNSINCTPYALGMLITQQGIPPSLLKRSEQGLIGVPSAFVETSVGITFEAAKPGWASHRSFVERARSKRATVFELLAGIEIFDSERQLFRGVTSDTLDIYYSPRVQRIMVSRLT